MDVLFEYLHLLFGASSAAIHCAGCCVIRPNKPPDGSAIDASDLIKQSLDERALEVLEGCVQLMNKHEVKTWT